MRGKHAKMQAALAALPQELSPEALRRLIEVIDELGKYLARRLPRDHPARRNYARAMRARKSELDAFDWTKADYGEERQREYQEMLRRIAAYQLLANEDGDFQWHEA